MLSALCAPLGQLAASLCLLIALAADFGCLGPAAASEDLEELEVCAQLLLSSRGGGDREQLMACRIPLLSALHRDVVPGYKYNATEDCHFWSHFAARDRTVEGSKALDFNRLAAWRLSEPFDPPLRPNGTALYVGAHRMGEDGVVFHRRHGLRIHLFEPSPTFFRSLREALAGIPELTLHNFGLGSRTRWASLFLSGTASRTLDREPTALLGGHVELPAEAASAAPPPQPAQSGEQEERVLIRAASEAVLEVLGAARRGEPGLVGVPPSIELLHVNCEGCEYDVVEGLRNSGLLARVEQVQIATHLLDHTGPTATFQEAVELALQVSVHRYCEMHRLLSETHVRVFGLPWVWERWSRRAAWQ